jgi:hypothetical protein
MSNEGPSVPGAEPSNGTQPRRSRVSGQLMFFGVAALALLVYCYVKSLPLARDQWTEFRSDAGRFSVSMPGAPAEKTESREVLALPLTLHQFRCRSAGGSEGCSVCYLDYPDALMKFLDASEEEMLDEIWKSSDAQGKSRLLHVRAITLAGYPGREMTCERLHASTNSYIRCRLYFVDRRLYLLSYESWRQPRLSSKEAETFLTSFQLTGAIKKPTPRPPRERSSCGNVSE